MCWIINIAVRSEESQRARGHLPKDLELARWNDPKLAVLLPSALATYVISGNPGHACSCGLYYDTADDDEVPLEVILQKLERKLRRKRRSPHQIQEALALEQRRFDHREREDFVGIRPDLSAAIVQIVESCENVYLFNHEHSTDEEWQKTRIAQAVMPAQRLLEKDFVFPPDTLVHLTPAGGKLVGDSKRHARHAAAHNRAGPRSIRNRTP